MDLKLLQNGRLGARTACNVVVLHSRLPSSVYASNLATKLPNLPCKAGPGVHR